MYHYQALKHNTPISNVWHNKWHNQPNSYLVYAMHMALKSTRSNIPLSFSFKTKPRLLSLRTTLKRLDLISSVRSGISTLQRLIIITWLFIGFSLTHPLMHMLQILVQLINTLLEVRRRTNVINLQIIRINFKTAIPGNPRVVVNIWYKQDRTKNRILKSSTSNSPNRKFLTTKSHKLYYFTEVWPQQHTGKVDFIHHACIAAKQQS
jgi:hypothetical protein